MRNVTEKEYFDAISLALALHRNANDKISLRSQEEQVLAKLLAHTHDSVNAPKIEELGLLSDNNKALALTLLTGRLVFGRCISHVSYDEITQIRFEIYE